MSANTSNVRARGRRGSMAWDAARRLSVSGRGEGTDTGRCVSVTGIVGGRESRRGVPVDRPLLADIPFSSPQPTDRIGSMESDAFSSFHPAAPRPQLARSCFSPFHTPRIKRLAGLCSVLTLIDRL